MRRLVRATTLALFLCHGSVGAQDSQPPAPGTPMTTAPAEEQGTSSTEHYGERDKACRQWSDGCRTCGRGADGAVACSNIGIACQPGTVRCIGSQDSAPAAK